MRQVCLEVVDEHPWHMRDLRVIKGRAGERLDHQRGVAHVKFDPGKPVLLVDERIVSYGQWAR